jgi:hypothetical protein
LPKENNHPKCRRKFAQSGHPGTAGQRDHSRFVKNDQNFPKIAKCLHSPYCEIIADSCVQMHI